MQALVFLLCACVSLEPAYVVIDGDTFVLAGERIRIANIDAPALQAAGCRAENQLGERAKRQLESLLVTGFITVNRGDPATGRLKGPDGDTLATVSIDGADVGEMMIEAGAARKANAGSARPAVLQASSSNEACVQATAGR
jgi:micrococcal nuclease